ncbi:hypothetical protein F9278_15780 [Streptomyces phaeolivaceus]|uniref:Uncharacterized protein n=1 Tax=Streptomyces phaeolivaceus TaxID=2653200 RepID=A0A5P8K3S2_9ACTN|nr:hypothetical protein [Streptomyces phaeolivaceus]QFQ97428.1 hypothetical protein F9278_15780 [Streptomyces phaeolivaceus]
MPELTDAQLTQLIKDIGLKRPRGGSERKPINHGTFRGARQHRYRKEPLCQPCQNAENAYQRERNAKGLRKKAAPKPKVYLTEEEWQARVAARQSGGAQ